MLDPQSNTPIGVRLETGLFAFEHAHRAPDGSVFLIEVLERHYASSGDPDADVRHDLTVMDEHGVYIAEGRSGCGDVPLFTNALAAMWWLGTLLDLRVSRLEAKRENRSRKARAAVTPAANRKEALFRLFHMLGTATARQDGHLGAWAKQEWDRRRALLCEGYGVDSSTKLTEAQLSVEIARMEGVLEGTQTMEVAQ